MAWAWVAHADSGLDPDLLGAYLGAYQATRELTLSELWALPTTLRVVLVENLRRLAERVAGQQQARDAAHRWLDADPDTQALATLQAEAEGFEARGLLESFLLAIEQRAERLPALRAQALEAWLLQRLPEASQALAREQAAAAEDLQSIRHAITSLRQIGHIDWRGLFEASTAAMQVLARSPVHGADDDAGHDAACRREARAPQRPQRTRGGRGLAGVDAAHRRRHRGDRGASLLVARRGPRRTARGAEAGAEALAAPRQPGGEGAWPAGVMPWC